MSAHSAFGEGRPGVASPLSRVPSIPPTTSVERAPTSASSDGVVARARAFVPDHEHRHFRDDGKGYVSHRHPVYSERHGHVAQGLAFALMRWPTWSWRRARGAAVYVATVGLFVGLAALTVTGWWFFARDIKWQ